MISTQTSKSGPCANTAPCVSFLDPAAFVLPAIGQFGNVGKGVFTGPGVFNWDLGAFKNFPVTERWRFQFRGELFNAFNHTNFLNPVTTVSGAPPITDLDILWARVLLMSDHLATYLHDHLAGSNFAVELIDNLQDQHANEPLGRFASDLKIEIEKDREILRQIIDQVGACGPTLKEAVAWIGEKVSRFKLRHATSVEFGTFEALELLGLGIQGKLALWRALSAIAPGDLRLRGANFEALISRAQAQHAEVEERRLQIATSAFRDGSR